MFTGNGWYLGSLMRGFSTSEHCFAKKELKRLILSCYHEYHDIMVLVIMNNRGNVRDFFLKFKF